MFDIMRKGQIEFGNNNSEKVDDIYDSYGGIKLKDIQMFTSDFLEKIKDYLINKIKGELKIGGVTFNENSRGELVGNGITINYDTKYNYIRVYNSDYSGYPLNINLQTGEIYVMDAKYLQSGSIKLFEALEKLGVLKNDLPFLNKEKFEKQKEENTFIENFLKSNNRNNLPFGSSNDLDSSKIKAVTQQEGIIINEPKEGEGLYTIGAGPCTILIVSDNTTGKIGLAHIDGSIKDTSIISFLSYFNNPDISIISGEKSVIGNVILGLKNAGLTNNVSFMNVDLDGSRNDSAGITIKNGKPTIVYGLNNNIKFSNEQEIKNKNIPFQTGKQSLGINIK